MGDAGEGSAGSATERVWAALPAGARSALEDKLSPTDLQTLLLDLGRTRASRIGPSRLRERWLGDRLVHPSATDPRRLAETDAALWRLLPRDVDGVALSPVTPLGTCAAVAPVDQHRVLSTVRSSEVVSDPTNVLALEAARRRRVDGGPMHLATCHRVLRTQRFSSPDAASHFELFALVSSARDAGSARTEADLLVRHLRFWSAALADLLGPSGVRIDLTVIGDGTLTDRLADTVRPALPGVRLADAPGRTQGIGYYRTAAFKIMVDRAGTEVELGDGGFTDWTASLRADAKERCLISCLATERLTALRAG